MAKNFRGDTFPVVVGYDGYTFRAGDNVTAGIFNESKKKLAEVSVTVTGDCEEVQLEFSREEMFEVAGKCIVEVRTVTVTNIEMTVQKEIEFEEDLIR